MEEYKDPKDTQDIQEAAGDEEAPSPREDELEGLRKKADENWQMFLRARADLENYRKRSDTEVARRVRQGKRDLLLGILLVMDNLERAMMQEGTEDGEGILEGVKMIHRQILDILGSEGVGPVKAVGEDFDPAFHECVAVFETDEVDREVISDELQKGYTYGSELLRPARVRVAKPPNG